MELRSGNRRYSGIEPEDLAPRVLMANFSVMPHPVAHRYVTPGLHLILVTDGRLWYRAPDGRRCAAKAGEMVVFYAGESVYGSEAPGPLALYQAHILPAAEPRRTAVPCVPGLGFLPHHIADISERRRCFAAYEKMSAALLAAGPTWAMESAGAAMELLHLAFDAAFRRRPQGPREPNRWERLLARIEAGDDRPRVSDLAKGMGMTAEHFIREFRRYAHVTPKQYILQRRLWKARGLLMQGCMAKEAAARCGFADPLYFSRAFRKVFGHPPSRAPQAAEDRADGLRGHDLATPLSRNIYAPGLDPRIFYRFEDAPPA